MTDAPWSGRALISEPVGHINPMGGGVLAGCCPSGNGTHPIGVDSDLGVRLRLTGLGLPASDFDQPQLCSPGI